VYFEVKCYWLYYSIAVYLIIIWSMVYLNTIPIRNLSHRIKNGNRENRQPVEPKSVKQHKVTKIKLKKIVGGNCPAPIWNIYMTKQINTIVFILHCQCRISTFLKYLAHFNNIVGPQIQVNGLLWDCLNDCHVI